MPTAIAYKAGIDLGRKVSSRDNYNHEPVEPSLILDGRYPQELRLPFDLKGELLAGLDLVKPIKLSE